jgi:peptide deformylase
MPIQLPHYEQCTTPPNYPDHWVVPSKGNMELYQRSRKLGLVPMHARALHASARAVPEDNIGGQDTRKVVDKLRRIADTEREMGRRLVGLAAPQAGIGVRIALIDLTPGDELGELTPFINPTLERGLEVALCSDGCFSCLGMTGLTRRSVRSRVQGFALDGTRQQAELEGLPSFAAQHETDHLDGWLMTDRLTDQARPVLWRPPEAAAEYSAFVRAAGDEGLAEPWPLVVPSEQLMAFDTGTLRMEHFTLREGS